jgi:hypothetical protein
MKNKKTVIKKGDEVRIINPEFFVRCGYELTPSIVAEQFTEEQKIKLFHSINEIFEIPTNITSSGDLFMFDKSYKSYVFEKILDQVAYYKVKKLGFGGPERKIYTKKIEQNAGKIFRVYDKKVVTTGLYNGAHVIRDYGSGMNEYEPAFLFQSKKHVILNLGFLDKPDWLQIGVDLQIEEKNVEVIK